MTPKPPNPAGGIGDRLRAFAGERGIPLTSEQGRRLEELDRLVAEWSRALDLTGFRDAEERVDRYFLEPLDATRWLPERTSGSGRSGAALDVGSGGGSPALPLALMRPVWRWTLLEPNRRRAVFLEEAVRRLGLQGAKVESARLDAFVPEGRYGLITSRGVSLDQKALARMGKWLEPGGRLLAFTGQARSEVLLGWRGPLEKRAQVALGPGLRGWLLVLERP